MNTIQDKTDPKATWVKPLNEVAKPDVEQGDMTDVVTTARDGELKINQGNGVRGDTEESIVQKPAPTPIETKPVIVTQEDVNSVSVAEGLMNKLEALSGEIQSLEARIDRLVGGTSSPVQAPPAEAKPASSESEKQSLEVSLPPAINAPLSSEVSHLPDSKMSPAVSVEKIPSPTIVANPASASIDDIYSSVETTGKNAKKVADDVSEDHSVVGGIGSLLVTLGIIMLILVLVTPFFKEMLGTDLFEMVKAIGWPVIIGLLGIGAVVIFFSMGRIVVKVLAVVFLLIAALMFMGVMGYDSFLGPLRTSLGSIFSFYR